MSGSTEARAALDNAIADALPLAGGVCRKRLKQLRRALDEIPANRPSDEWGVSSAYLIYSSWHKRGDRSTRSVWGVIQEAYRAGKDATDG